MHKELKQWIDCLQCMAKKLLKQRLDFPFEERIETTDTLPTRKSRKNCSNKGDIFHWTKELKRRRDCLQEEAKTLLKQKFDFLFRKDLKQRIDCLQCKAKQLLKNSLITHLRKELKQRIDNLQTKIRNC